MDEEYSGPTDESGKTATDHESKYREMSKEERRERIVKALEKGADAAVWGSEALLVWLFSPDRPTRVKEYFWLWVKIVAVFVAAYAGLGEYAHWRAPYYYGAETIFANPEFMEIFLETTGSFIWISGLLVGFAWILQHAASKDASDKEIQADRVKQEHEQMTSTD